MTAQQKNDIKELAKFAPCLLGKCKDFMCEDTEFKPLKEWIENNAKSGYVTVIGRKGYVVQVLQSGIKVMYREASHIKDYTYCKVVIQRTINKVENE